MLGMCLVVMFYVSSMGVMSVLPYPAPGDAKRDKSEQDGETNEHKINLLYFQHCGL